MFKATKQSNLLDWLTDESAVGELNDVLPEVSSVSSESSEHSVCSEQCVVSSVSIVSSEQFEHCKQ